MLRKYYILWPAQVALGRFSCEGDLTPRPHFHRHTGAKFDAHRTNLHEIQSNLIFLYVRFVTEPSVLLPLIRASILTISQGTVDQGWSTFTPKFKRENSVSNQNTNAETSSLDGDSIFETLGLSQAAEIAKVKQALAAGQSFEKKSNQQTIRTSSNTNFKR